MLQPFTGLALFFIHMYQGADPVQYVKFGLRAVMLLTSLSLTGRTREHIFLSLAFAASVFSDYFLWWP